MPQVDRFLLAFRHDLINAGPHGLDHYARLYWDDRQAFYQAQETAWRRESLEPYLSLTEARGLNEALPAKTAWRFAHLLLAAGRFEEAAILLRDRRLGLEDDPHALLDLARVELGLGRKANAAFAASRAAERDPGVAAEAAQIGETLAVLAQAQEAAAASRAWSDARAVFELWIQAGSIEGGRGAILAFLTGGGALEQSEINDFHAALDTVLSLCRPEAVYGLFRALAGQPIYARRGDVLQAVCAALYGDPAEPAAPVPTARSVGASIGGSLALGLARLGRGREAITLLGELSLVFHKQHQLRPALARMVGRQVLAAHPLRYGPDGGGRKIFDVFLFNNELRTLQMKLHEMADWVDGFVLVEARQTFTGAPKPLVFQENREQFARFADKIVHVVVDAFPDYVRHPWAREYHQRDMGIVGLSGQVREDDLVIISDSDEVISRSALQDFDRDYAPMGLERMRYFLNYRQVLPPDQLRQYPSVWRARYLRSIGLSSARETVRALKKARPVSPAGWHFTSVSDAPGIVAKLSNSSHQEHAGVAAAAIDDMLARLRSGDYDAGWERCDIDERFPRYLRDHLEDFEDVIL